jgi:hypothetical protein
LVEYHEGEEVIESSDEAADYFAQIKNKFA